MKISPRRPTRATRQSGHLEDDEEEGDKDPLAISGDDSNIASEGRGRGRKRRSNDGAESSERYDKYTSFSWMSFPLIL